jgi:hypothetical protein
MVWRRFSKPGWGCAIKAVAVAPIATEAHGRVMLGGSRVIATKAASKTTVPAPASTTFATLLLRSPAVEGCIGRA